ncbi:alpha/beta hydrolase-fold protein [Isosphaeraceae bacterium EP7]
MRRLAWIGLWLLAATPAYAQLGNHTNLNRLNRRICGRVVDYTQNHGQDNRIPSAALGIPRDLYVYLPPGYTPTKAYPLVLDMHVSYIDEHTFVALGRVSEIDQLITSGQMPPTIVACVDGLVDGKNSIFSVHSFFLDGVRGRFETHVLQEVIPFLMTQYSIRPEPQAHALVGVSAGGFGAMSIALRHPELFGAVAAIGAPLNLRYTTCRGRYFDNFDPSTFRWSEVYDPNMVIGKAYFSLRKTRAKAFMAPVFGDGPDVVSRVKATNPADIIARPDFQPGQLAMYIAYAGRDNYNFDAHAESFLWIARQRGIAVDAVVDPFANHGLRFFRENHIPAYLWASRHILPPVDLIIGAPAIVQSDRNLDGATR